MFIYGEMHGKYGFSFIRETPKRREPACMGIYEEVHGKDELKETGQDSAPYMRHPKGESLHVCSFMRRCTACTILHDLARNRKACMDRMHGHNYMGLKKEERITTFLGDAGNGRSMHGHAA